jgi:hypothetical protein
MSTTSVAIGDLARTRLGAFRRPIVVAVVFIAAGGLIACLVTSVPVTAPVPGTHHLLLFCPLAPLPLPGGDIARHWPVAVGGLGLVLLIDAVVVSAALRRARRMAPPQRLTAEWRSPLRLERVPMRAVAITAAASLTVLVAGLSLGYAMWIPVGFALIPWLPLVAMEAAWKYEHYGFWAIFGVAVLLQIGHMGEHTVQVTQLLLYHGKLAQSHGVFGQLDFETVHFVWDSAIWVLLCIVLLRFARGNRWLWIAFAAASVHEVEHLYLFWVYTIDPWFYFHGGLEGIMGNGGLIGSPVARPYLHFAYNFLVVVPMVLAFLDQTTTIVDRSLPTHALGRSALGPAVDTPARA